MTFTRYVALGDSMSMDLYPALDAGETAIAVNLEWSAGAGDTAPLGAASQLHRNDDARWPQFTADDLATRCPGLTYLNLAEDGAVIGDVFGGQLDPLAAAVGDDGAGTLLTLTLGGNDLLHALLSRPSAHLMAAKARDIGMAYAAVVDAIVAIAPGARLLLTTVYDPSDGTGDAEGIVGVVDTLPLEHLAAFNAVVHAVAARHANAAVADAHAHFLGHGVTAPEDERWYWRRSIIEPSALGASELRRLWLELVQGSGRRSPSRRRRSLDD